MLNAPATVSIPRSSPSQEIIINEKALTPTHYNEITSVIKENSPLVGKSNTKERQGVAPRSSKDASTVQSMFSTSPEVMPIQQHANEVKIEEKGDKGLGDPQLTVTCDGPITKPNETANDCPNRLFDITPLHPNASPLGDVGIVPPHHHNHRTSLSASKKCAGQRRESSHHRKSVISDGARQVVTFAEVTTNNDACSHCFGCDMVIRATREMRHFMEDKDIESTPQSSASHSLVVAEGVKDDASEEGSVPSLCIGTPPQPSKGDATAQDSSVFQRHQFLERLKSDEPLIPRPPSADNAEEQSSPGLNGPTPRKRQVSQNANATLKSITSLNSSQGIVSPTLVATDIMSQGGQSPPATSNESSFHQHLARSLRQRLTHAELVDFTATLLEKFYVVQHTVENRLVDPCTCAMVAMTGMEVDECGGAATGSMEHRCNAQEEEKVAAPPAAAVLSGAGHRDSAAFFKRSLVADGRSMSLSFTWDVASSVVIDASTNGSTQPPVESVAVALQPSPSGRGGTTFLLSPSQHSNVGKYFPPPVPAGLPPRGGRQRSVAFQVNTDAHPSDPAVDSGESATPRAVLAARKSLLECHVANSDFDDVSGFEMVNQYLLMEQVGSGAYGIVYAVCDTNTNADYAMKVIKKGYGFQNKRESIRVHGTIGGNALNNMSSVNREVAIMKKLRHPNIVRLHEVIDDPKQHKLFLVMQLLPGGVICPSLDAATGECTPVERDLLKKYVYQICDGLRYLHRHCIIHRDLKPENMMLDEHGNVVLVDFGVSEVAMGEEGEVEGVAGTPAFMAPEVWHGDRVSGAAADVWSLGVSIFMMLTGRSPFTAKTKQELIEAIQTKEPVFPANTDKEWVTLLKGMLAKDPSMRLSLSTVMRSPMFAAKSIAQSRDTEKTRRKSQLSVLESSSSVMDRSCTRNAIVVTEEDVEGAIAERREDVAVYYVESPVGSKRPSQEFEHLEHQHQHPSGVFLVATSPMSGEAFSDPLSMSREGDACDSTDLSVPPRQFPTTSETKSFAFSITPTNRDGPQLHTPSHCNNSGGSTPKDDRQRNGSVVNVAVIAPEKMARALSMRRTPQQRDAAHQH